MLKHTPTNYYQRLSTSASHAWAVHCQWYGTSRRRTNHSLYTGHQENLRQNHSKHYNNTLVLWLIGMLSICTYDKNLNIYRMRDTNFVMQNQYCFTIQLLSCNISAEGYHLFFNQWMWVRKWQKEREKNHCTNISLEGISPCTTTPLSTSKCQNSLQKNSLPNVPISF